MFQFTQSIQMQIISFTSFKTFSRSIKSFYNLILLYKTNNVGLRDFFTDLNSVIYIS